MLVKGALAMPTRHASLLNVLVVVSLLLPAGGAPPTAAAWSRSKTPSIHALAQSQTVTAQGVAALTAGDEHTCALTSTGGVKCWGWNADGQLGDGTTTHRSTPVDVSGLTSGVTAPAAGSAHTCAVTNAGGVKCWGDNYWGQLGDGTTIDRYTPVDVSGLMSEVTALAAGGGHTCALTSTGGAKCWGWNADGQLGDGTTTDRSTPVDVSGLTSGVTALAVGYLHTCAVTTAGGVKCWGDNYWGQLGDGTTTAHSTPVDVSGLTSGVTALAAGSAHTCAVTSTSGVKCWGANHRGQLGDGTTTARSTPVDASGLTSGVAVLAAGADHTCAVTSAGGVKCWGYNGYGQLGDGTTTARSTPVDVSGLTSGVASAVFNRQDSVLVILENFYTSATGQQANPSTGRNARDEAVPMSIPAALRGVGVKWIRQVNPYRISRMLRVLREALTTREPGLKVVIARGECQLERQRRERPMFARRAREGHRVVKPRFGVDPDVCTGDHSCMRFNGCPSLTLKENPDPLRDDPVAHVDQSCVGCGVCGEVAHTAALCPSFYEARVVENPSLLDRARARVGSALIALLAGGANGRPRSAGVSG